MPSTPQWPAPAYTDGDFTTAQPVGIPVFSSPVPGSTVEYVFRQDFMQFRANVTALALGTAHPSSGQTPDYSTWMLVAEGDKLDVGAGVVRWTRTYAKVPATHNEWESYVYDFIGTSPTGLNSSAGFGRLRFSARVTSRLQHDYFFVNPSLSNDAAPIYKDAGNIPIVRAFKYCAQFVDSGTQRGGWHYPQDYVSDSVLVTGVGVLSPTIPSDTAYASMVRDASSNKWQAGVSQQILTSTTPVLVDIAGMKTYPDAYPSGSPPAVTCLFGQIPAEDSILTRWHGNIFLRRSRYVLAQ